MDVRIESIRLQNFKGTRNLYLEMNGQDTSVFGRNATGKTSIFDAFLWVLFGKDSNDRSDFWVKPHDANGDEVHFLETEVTLTLSLDGGKQITFRHMLVENWVKKNGEADRVFSGNQHKYWLNDVSKSASEYTAAVTEIVKPEVFRLIANPMAFNELDWKKRREFLLQLSPVDIDAIMLARPEYGPIKDELASRDTDLDGIKKIARDQKSRDDDELSKIPVRVSELTSIINEIGDCDTVAAERRKAEISSEIEQIDDAMKDGTAVIDQIKSAANAVTALESQIRDRKKELYFARSNAHSTAHTELVSASTKLKSMRISHADIVDRIGRTTKQIADSDTKAAAFRNEWYKIDDEPAPEYTGAAECPTCGQNLPIDQIEASKKRFLDQVQAEKVRRLEFIEKQGIALSGEIESLRMRLSKDTVERDKLAAEIAKIEPTISALETEAKALAGDPDYSKDEAIASLEFELAIKRSEYEDSVSGKKPVDEALVQKRKGLHDELTGLASVAAKKQQMEVCITRIHALEARQKELGIQIAETERFLLLIDKFVAERCGALEESINSLFPTVRWSLFERKINGGLKEVCNCLIGGTQFSDANDAAKINSGLEIIQVLSKHYGVSVPVFVDNAESINELRRIGSQIVAMFVTDNDHTLRVESGIQDKEVA